MADDKAAQSKEKTQGKKMVRVSQAHTTDATTDVVYTPTWLAETVVKHFNPSGRVLEPCYGGGAFVRALEQAPLVTSIDWCEIAMGRDFFDVEGHWNWIVTNPPWSKYEFPKFLKKSMQVADNIVFLCHCSKFAGSYSNKRFMKAAGFGVREVMEFSKIVDEPGFKGGLMIGATWIQRGWTGRRLHVDPYDNTQRFVEDDPYLDSLDEGYDPERHENDGIGLSPEALAYIRQTDCACDACRLMMRSTMEDGGVKAAEEEPAPAQ
jgi:hypothetical protein